MSFYVYSTLSNTTNYAVYRPTKSQDPNSTPIIDRKISIRGGANVAPLPQFGIVTPQGVVTQISDEDMAILEQDYHFKEHCRLGFIKVEKKEQPIEKSIASMEAKDQSAPKTPQDFEEKKVEGQTIYKDKETKRK